jgi:hypothetical protein
MIGAGIDLEGESCLYELGTLVSDPLSEVILGCDMGHGSLGHGVVLENSAPFELLVRFDDGEVGDRGLRLAFAPVTIHRDGVEINFRDALSEQPLNALAPQEEAFAIENVIATDLPASASKAIGTADQRHHAATGSE